ncbi:MAG: hypothetical protein QOH90_401 [Actinomycetota bacterium]|nr:hypothetical protein [Actinomycetota bacterium]
MTRLTNEERKAVIERFFERITEGIPVDQQWVTTMRTGSSPELPQDPTREQLDAWIELAEIVTDEGFIAEMRATTEKFWSDAPSDFEPGALFKAYAEVSDNAAQAMASGLSPSSSEGGAIAERVITSHARAVHKEDDEGFRASMLDGYANQDPRAARYWELLATIRGDESAAQQTRVTNWIAEAVRARLSG